jgi:hypothetical protein
VDARKLHQLVLAERTVHRGGRQHIQHFWVREDEARAAEAKGAVIRVSSQRRLKQISKSVWGHGRLPEAPGGISKLETGNLGENIAIDFLKDHGFSDAKLLHLTAAVNLPVDAVAGDHLFEIKCGLASSKSPRWKVTLGTLSKEGQAWIKTAGDEEKAKFNVERVDAALARKELALTHFSSLLGRQLTGKTIGIIVDPATKTCDVHIFDGFHRQIGWSGDKAKAGYVGTYKYR